MATIGGSFDERMAYLSDAVGYGILTAECVVDQPYAQIQHENEQYNHRVGRSHYLGGPLLENAVELVADLAWAAIKSHGSDLENEMVNVAERMSGYVFVNAPKDTTLLSTSAHPSVTDAGVVIYDRPPISPREVD